MCFYQISRCVQVQDVSVLLCFFSRQTPFENYWKPTNWGTCFLFWICVHISISITYMYVYMCTSTYIYIYQHMPRGVIMAPLREGVSKWRPFISKVFLNLFGVIWDIHFIFVIWGHGSNAFEFYFWHPKNGACQTCHLRVGWMCRGCQNATPLG